MVRCDLIPLAVLKLGVAIRKATLNELVTCDLIPLAVLKLGCSWCYSLRSIVTCDLIPLAVLKHRIYAVY